MVHNDHESMAILPPISFSFMEWDLYGPPVIDQRRASHSTTLVSTMWMSKMLSEFFWQDPAYPRKSDRYFHRRTLFRLMRNRRYKLRDLPSAPDPEDRIVMEAWEEQKRQLETNRNLWNHAAVDLWRKSPWRDRELRMQYHDFPAAFAKRNFGKCMQIARRIFGLWNYRRDLIKECVVERTTALSTFSMIWQSIGLLMMASLPLLKEDQYKFLVRKATVTTVFKSSRDALAHGRDLTVHTHVPGDHYDTINGPSEFFNLEGVRVENFTQIDYLNRIQGVFEVMRVTGCIVPAQFLRNITNAVTALRADRAMQAAFNQQHTDCWASSWFFTFPVYDSNYVVYDERYKTWVPVDNSLVEADT
ncbi:hypothetical protein F5Y03DRAFT_376375 [Xylaria venustula]|nr:hypothetical protein F5Y03DRAFT_376375 [Xylaria venustula]